MIVKPEGLEFFGVVLRSAAIRTNSRTAAGAVETNRMEATTVTSAFLVLREKQSLSLRTRKIINAPFKTEIVPKVKQTPLSKNLTLQHSTLNPKGIASYPG